MKNEFTDLEHFCSYTGMSEENKVELCSLVVNLIKANEEVQTLCKDYADRGDSKES